MGKGILSRAFDFWLGKRVYQRVVQVLVLLILLGLVAAFLVLGNLGKVLRAGVQIGGSRILGVQVGLRSASVSLLNGSAELKDLTLGSPSGFRAPEMFSLSRGYAKLDIWSLRQPELVVQDVVIDGPEVTLEFSGAKTNWGTLMERLRQERAQEEPKTARKVRVDRLVVQNAKLRIAGVPVAGTMSVPLPRFEVTGLRAADGRGMDATEALARLVDALYGAVAAAAKTVLSPEEAARLAQELDSALGKAAGALEQGRSQLKEAVTGGAEKARSALEGVLGGQKEE
jgi:hypothetical protein